MTIVIYLHISVRPLSILNVDNLPRRALFPTGKNLIKVFLGIFSPNVVNNTGQNACVPCFVYVCVRVCVEVFECVPRIKRINTISPTLYLNRLYIKGQNRPPTGHRVAISKGCWGMLIDVGGCVGIWRSTVGSWREIGESRFCDEYGGGGGVWD